MAEPLHYLAGYSAELRNQVRAMIRAGTLGQRIVDRYGARHAIQSNQALYEHVMALKREHLASSPPLGKVLYCDKISTLNHALGLHTYATRVQGGKLKTKNEIRIAGVFRQAPQGLLDLIVVHELAHLRERDHDKAFYRLCEYMLPDYHQRELDMRLWLTWLDLQKSSGSDAQP